ncbi:autotransporter outer membrane beta-barrel domain-containing protein [Mesorhizobium sp. M1423]|uniref:autotransporter domain-containing protein n=1 Tax=Mesorhizobium sp. M1423 TaxID=2957101 RepID=UPI00333CA479
MRSQVSRLALRSAIGIAAAAGASLLTPGQAWADCLVGFNTVQCDNTVTTDTIFPTNPPVDRHYEGVLPVPIVATVDPGTTVSGNGLALVNTGAGGVTVTNNGGISVDAGNTPTSGGTAALSIRAAGGPITYTGGSITNNGNGNAFDAVQTGGVGSVNINVTGDVTAAAGEGITVRDVTTSTGISVATANVTALTAGKDGIDAQSQSLTGNLTEVANGNIQAGNAGMVAALLQGAATGNINVTANGSIDARFGIDAENFGSGSTSVTTIGPVNVTTGNGIFALSTGGNVIVTAGDVTAVSNTAIIAQQTKVAGAGVVDVTAGNVSGTTGIDAHNFGTGAVAVVANGTVTGTAAEGIKAIGNGAVSVSVADTVTGATRGLSLIGGTGGSGNISVTGAGGFVGGTGDAANILNNGSGTVTVDISGASSSAGGEGIFVRDTTIGGNISITTGAVTALTAGKDGIDVQAQSLTGNLTEVANGNIQAGNAGMVAALIQGAATGNINVTANGSIDARFGIDAENFGSGSTSVTTVGPVNVTTGNGIFALTAGGNVIVNAGDVTSTGNTAIIAQQTKVAGAGLLGVTAGNVSGTTGIDAHNFGTGDTGIVANGTVTGTAAEGVKVIGNAGVFVSVANTVTGATRGLSLIGGTGGSGNISVTGAGGFVGGTGDAANILNNGNGNTTVNISGASSSAGGEGIFVRDTAIGGNISITTGAVTALTAGKDGIDVQAQTLTGNLTEVANGNIQAGNAGMVAAIIPGAATGNVDVTANGSINARFGIDAENFGSGSTTVTAVGPVTVTSGNGIFASSTGGAVTVTAGDVTSTGNTAIVARQNKAAGAGAIDVTAGNVSGTTGIFTSNAGTGVTTITATGTVEGDVAAIVAQSNAGHAIGITLSGATHNSALTATALAITTSGGATTLTNGAALTGRVEFGDFADLVTNNATWRTGGTSLFGAGIDSVVNAAGASLVTAGNGGLLETTTFSGLESLSNNGLLTMQDGGAGDRTLLSGDATLAAGSTYAIDIDAALQSDLLHAAGAVTITGSTLSVNGLGGLVFGAHYTVLTADGGLTGEFGSVTGLPGNTAFLGMVDTYDANNAYLDVLKVRDFADAGLTRNQIATGQGLDSIPESGSLFNAVVALATDAEARSAFDQLSGEVHASAKGMLLNDSQFVRDAATNRIRAAFGDAGAAALPVMAYGEGGPEMVAADTDRFAVWGQAFGSWGKSDSDGNAAAFDRSIGGLLAGADTLLGGWRVGLLGGYSRSSFDADDRQSSGDADSYHLGLYGGTNWGAIAFRSGAAYSWNSLSTKRSVAFAGFADQLTGDYDASTAQVFGELAYKIDAGGADAGRFKFEPFANLAYVSVHTDGFTEKGGGAALTSASSTTDATFTTLGLRASTDFALGGINTTARGMVGWRHAFGDVTPVSSFAFAGGDAFTIAGVPIAQDSAVIEAGLDLQMSANATLGLSYSGQFGSGVVDNGAKADLRVKF